MEQHELPLNYTEDQKEKTMSKDKTMPKEKTASKQKATTENKHMNTWVSFRPEARILDCTVRDGGLMNSHQFTDEVVKAIYLTCVEAGIDYMEMGYINSRRLFLPDKYGDWKYCSEDDLRRIVGDNDTELKLSAMADAEKSDYQEDILPSSQSVLDMIRVACYIHQIPLALDMVKDAHDKGYETTINLMAVSTVFERELNGALELLANSEVDTVYVVDSNGSLYSEQVHFLIDKYMYYMKSTGKRIGMHAHNNQQLAFSNTIEGVIKGATILDASMAGLGRGAGNCPMELLVGFLHNPKYRLRPILRCIQDYIEPMRKDLLWGFDIPYMMTGLLNRHPRSGMSFNISPDRGDLVKFYDIVTEESL